MRRRGTVIVLLAIVAVITSLFPSAAALKLVSITLSGGLPNFPTLDEVNGYAYFPLQTVPGEIAKLNLATSKIVSTLKLKESSSVWGSAIDVQNQNAYFTLVGLSEYVVKVDLSSFKEVGSILLQGTPHAIVIDSQNKALYVGTYGIPGVIFKISLATFRVSTQINLPSGDNFVSSGIVDPTNGVAYFVLRIAPTTIAEITTSNFKFSKNIVTKLPGITSNGPGGYSDDGYVSSMLDAVNHVAYFGTHSNPAIISVLDTATAHVLNTITTEVAIADCLILASAFKTVYVCSLVSGNMSLAAISLVTGSQTNVIQLSSSGSGTVHGGVLYQGNIYLSLHDPSKPGIAKVSIP